MGGLVGWLSFRSCYPAAGHAGPRFQHYGGVRHVREAGLPADSTPEACQEDISTRHQVPQRFTWSMWHSQQQAGRVQSRRAIIVCRHALHLVRLASCQCLLLCRFSRAVPGHNVECAVVNASCCMREPISLVVKGFSETCNAFQAAEPG